ncbi:MAG: polysaccharide deacetylase family protein [Bacteroidales bacterium]|nr:polysaccharide deacetylase family protein [Bacteroidales bacterium]MCF8337210.1 polysaccharide deacetylase family protein [Bacteroidales bacterium]
MKTYFIKSGKFLSKLIYPSLIWEIPTSRDEIFLTFDDGPTPGVTEKTLDILDRFNAKATFFMVGEKASRYPELVDEIIKRGHKTGNHTYHHLKGWSTEDDAYFEDIAKTDTLLHTKLFRPPHGKIRRSQIAFLIKKYHIVMWTVLSADFDSSISPEHCLHNVIHNTGKGSIIIFHDSPKASERMLYALPKTLEHFQAKGYAFKSLEL